MAEVGTGLLWMNLIERYRRYAADCLKLGRSAANDADRALLLQMAETWRQLAQRAEAKVSARGRGSAAS
jgi:hypothetical protein